MRYTNRHLTYLLTYYMATIGQHHTRGNSWKLTVMRCRFDLRKYCFTNRIVNMWNSLPDNVILANNVNHFKNRLDKHWKMHDIVFNYRADFAETGGLNQSIRRGLE